MNSSLTAMVNACARRAFTLIELLIVVAIIAVLAAIAVPNFLESQTRAKVSRAKSDMRAVATALLAGGVEPADMGRGRARPRVLVAVVRVCGFVLGQLAMRIGPGNRARLSSGCEDGVKLGTLLGSAQPRHARTVMYYK